MCDSLIRRPKQPRDNRALVTMSDSSVQALTFVFADLESSTRLWERSPDAMPAAVERHDDILRNAVVGRRGRVVKITGDGLMAVFASADAAVEAACEAQLALQREPWEDTGPLRVRMGIHTGEAHARANDYYGPTVNRAARIMATAHGGQVLLSAVTARLAKARLPKRAGLRDLGEHRLKDLSQSEHLFQLVHPELPSAFPPLATLSRRANNLPAQTSEFLGREVQLAAISDLLEAEAVRLVTLTGPGGIGKTRLALQAAANRIDRFDDGVYFVDLSAARDEEAVFQAIVHATGLGGSAGEPPLELLTRELLPRRMLLLLDNFEQVIGAAGGVAELLRHAPRLNVVATSREALRVDGEHLFPVPPMSLPGVVETKATAGQVAHYEAVRLFVERARAVEPRFALTDENAPAVTEICARLDGLPLAIELAAARLTLFSLDELRSRLGSRLEVLRGGARDRPARQQTLRRMIEWSYDLLDEDERAIFLLISVFATAEIKAVEEVASRIEQLGRVDIDERLASLVNKSLLRSVESDGRRRLSMLETIREYAAERLDGEPELSASAVRAHADYFTDFASLRSGRLYGFQREHTLVELGEDLGNLTTAWRYWVGAADPERLNGLLDSLLVLHDVRGSYRQAVELVNDLLGVLDKAPSTLERMSEQIALRMSLARGLMAIGGYTAEVEDAFGRALELSKETGELQQRPTVLRSLATFHLYRGEFEKSGAYGRELLALADLQRDAGLEIEGRLVLGSTLSFLGDLPTGIDHLERAIALFDPQEHRTGRFRFGASPGASACNAAALLRWLQGDLDRANDHVLRALQVAAELDHPFTLSYTHFHAGFLEVWRRDLPLVQRQAATVLEVAEEHGYQIWQALALVLQGLAAAGLGQPDKGLERVQRGIDLYQGVTSPAVFWPLVLYLRARAFAFAGRFGDGIAAVDDAIGLTGQESFLYPEFALLRAELLAGLLRAEDARLQLESGLETAERHGLRTSQLRLATASVRLSGKLSRGRGADLLRAVYGTFTEGLTSPDLEDARAVLREVDVSAV
jgi:predicted ATPase/class 3 adenylate cyclase